MWWQTLKRWTRVLNAPVHPRKLKFLILNLVGLALMGAGLYQGLVQPYFSASAYYLPWIVAAPLPVGLWAAWTGRWSDVDKAASYMVGLGILFTVVGMGLAFSGVTGEVNVSLRDFGGFTMIYTTVIGLAGAQWLSLNDWIINRGGLDD